MTEFKLYPKNIEAGWKPWAPKEVIEKGIEIPTLTDEEFLRVLVNRSSLGDSVHGGSMINDFIKDQIDTDKGDAIVLMMHTFSEWYTIINDFQSEEDEA